MGDRIEHCAGLDNKKSRENRGSKAALGTIVLLWLAVVCVAV